MVLHDFMRLGVWGAKLRFRDIPFEGDVWLAEVPRSQGWSRSWAVWAGKESLGFNSGGVWESLGVFGEVVGGLVGDFCVCVANLTSGLSGDVCGSWCESFVTWRHDENKRNYM